jgi:hypothetical protein
VWPCRRFRHRFDSEVPRTRAWRWLAKPGQLHTEHVTRFSSRSDNPPTESPGKWLKSSSPPADPDCMSRKGAVIVVAAVALVASTQAVGLSRSAVPRGKAERNILRFLARGWGNHRLPRLVDPRTHLLRNNTQAICRRARGQPAGSFVCVVRPARHRPREGLYVSYRSLAHGRFRVKWLYYRRG